MGAPAPFGGGVFIADTSAWARTDHHLIADAWAEALAEQQIRTCPIVAFELLYSARTTAEYRAIEEQLSALLDIPVTATVCSAARAAMRELAEHSDGYHRVKIPDLLIAACAQEGAVGVLHYDHHFDHLTQVLSFESRWIAEAGDLDHPAPSDPPSKI